MEKSPPTTAPVPGWEKILQRLSIGNEAAQLTKSRLRLLRTASDPRLNFRLALERVVGLLPKAIGVHAVIIYKTTAQATTLVASNLAKNQALYLLSFSDIHRQGKGGRMAQHRIKPVGVKNTRRRLNFVTSFTIGDERNLQVRLLSETALSAEEMEILEVAHQALVIRHQQRVLKKQLDREQEHFTLLTQHLSEGMVVIDRNGKITLWNRPMQRLTGISPREAIGSGYSEVLRRPDDPAWLNTLIQEHQATPLRNVFTTEFQILTPAKQFRWVQVSGSFFRRSEHDIEQTILITRDVSHIKELETRKNEFISIATHELRTPITAIKGYLSLLSKNAMSFTDQQRLYMNRAIEANNRLVNLAEDLLKAVQVEEDRLRINLRPFELYPILEKIVHDFTSKASTKNLVIKLDKPKTSTMIVADPEKTEQVFSNLVDNAIKYTHEGEITISTSETEIGPQGYLMTEINDTGIGISPKFYKEIFEKFRRTHGPEQARESGAGLGLFIVKSFVEKQGGKISVSSRIGKGTTFSVMLPIAEVPEIKEKNEKGQE